MRHGQFKKALSVSVRKETYDSIKNISENKKVSMGDVVREILEGHFKHIHAKDMNDV